MRRAITGAALFMCATFAAAPSGQPVINRFLPKPQDYEVAFSEDKADFWRRDSGIVTHMEVIVSAEDNAEMRRVSVTNFGNRPREIELTSYSEVVLAPQSSDVAHPGVQQSFHRD